MSTLMPYYRDLAQLPGPLPELQETKTAVANTYPNSCPRAEYVVVARDLYVVRYGPLSPKTKVMLCSSSNPTSPFLHHGFAQCIGT